MDLRARAAMGVGALVLSSIAVSCSLLVDTDALSGPAQSAAQPDSGAATGEAGANDGGSSGGSGDANNTNDTGLVSDPCTDNPVHCETFDQGDPLSRNGLDVDPTTSVTIDETTFVSAPRSAKCVIEPSTNNGSPDATLGFRTSTPLTSNFVFEGSVFIERFEPQQFGRLLRLGNDGTDPPILLERNGNFKLDNAIIGSVGEVPSGKWLKIRVEARPTSLTVTVDGKGPGTLAAALNWANDKPLIVRFGISEANSPTTGWIVHWDNIVIRKL